jgi:hypothetical protein
MKKLLLLFFTISPFCYNPDTNAQTADWTPIFLTVSGNHIVKGLEGYFQKGICNNEDVVFVKFVNTNPYSVALTWYNAVFTHEIKWYYNANDTKSLTVPAATTSEGTCGGEALLIIKLSDFISDPNQFKRYCSVELTISPVN